jgi:hypothetical protein
MQTTTLTLALGTLCSLALTPRVAHAQLSQTVITGRVTTLMGFGLEAAHVDVTDEESGRAVAAITAGDGHYAIFGLPADHHYRVLFRRIGFAPLTRAVAPTPGGSGDPVVDAALAPISGELSVARREGGR